MRSALSFRRIAVAVILGSLLLTVAVIARAQAGSNDFASWSTVRQGGKAVTTITPAPGRPGLPSTHIRPDAIGGITRTVASDASSARWAKALGIPFTSSYTGATQTLAATVGRTATKAAIIDTAIAASKVTSPAGWAILGAGVMGAYFGYSPSLESLYTKLVPETTTEGSSSPPTTVTECRVWYDTLDGGWQSSCEASCANVSNQNVYCTNAHEMRWQSNGSLFGYASTATREVQSCPPGSELIGGECVTPGSSGCPDGYSYAVNFFYGGFECAPNPGTPPVQTPAPDALVSAAMDQTIGTDGGQLEDLLNDLPGMGPGVLAPLDNPAADGPSSLNPTTTTTNLNDGGRIETTASHPVTYINNFINIGDTITTTTYNSNNEIINQTTTEGTGGPANFPDDYATRDRQCGYPGGPACKIDEEGTPESGDFSQAEATRDSAFDQLGELPQEIIDQERDTGWGLSFNPPTSCSNPPAFALPFAGINLALDMCQWEPEIHAVMSFLWIIFTLFSCVTMVREAIA